MKTDQAKKVVIKVDSNIQQENVKNLRRTLKPLQPLATDKENLAGRSLILKNSKQLQESEYKKEKPELMHKAVQTDPYIATVDDLTSEEGSVEYWKRVAEKRQESLDVSLCEIEKLKDNIEALQEENKICKEMLEESKNLVEVLQEIINDGDNEETPDNKADDTEETESENQL
ncbi:geminin [Sitophilus oryzae]|uniref:Geminin n=1 Tax=Sitophilus oryzae TaxID=7048 RepID=A0A6J2YLR2_SITOR|nr:geminin [Sitophilus oryzae]